MKVCRDLKCQYEEKPQMESNFYAHPNTRDHLGNCCKDCAKKKAKKWSEDNPERRKLNARLSQKKRYPLFKKEQIKKLKKKYKNNKKWRVGQKNYNRERYHKNKQKK